jgi:thiopeptide-type bacteriocin biosynthesis protein
MLPIKGTFSEQDIDRLLNDEFFLEAIYIASPVLYKECLLYKQGLIKEEKDKQKIINGLLRYYSRMSTRCTPFGLFSTVGVARFNNGNEHENKKTGENSSVYRHTRLDMYFLQRMTGLFLQMPFLAKYILFYPNNSIYPVNKEIRYIEYTYLREFRQSKISAIVQNQYITRVLENSRNGITKEDLVKIIVDENVDEATATQFIEELVSSQVLISEFEVATTSDEDYILQIIRHLASIYERSKDWYVLSVLDILRSTVADLRKLDERPVNSVQEYQRIIDKVRMLQPVIVEEKTFHVDAYRRYDTATVGIRESVKRELTEALQFMLEMNGGSVMFNNNIEKFKSKFTNRYDTAFIPLVEVLDTDLGIGYPVNKQKKSSPLVDDIPLGNAGEEGGRQVNLSRFENWLLEILKHPDNQHKQSIHLDKCAPPKGYKPAAIDWGQLPRSISAIFRLKEDERQTLFAEFFGGPSAAQLLARFTYGNKEIRDVAEKIIAHEDSVTENAVYVEIVHLPDDRISNILMHPGFRKYELPYLAVASADQENIIPINDIYVTVAFNQIILFSKSLNKRIIPCKTHMHTHSSMNSLPLYHFWGDLQQEYNNRLIGFSINSISSFLNFVPRICYKETILSLATWNLPMQVISNLDSDRKEGLAEKIVKLRTQYNIPERVLYIDRDNELYVDFTDLRSVNNWLKAIRNSTVVVLKEVLWENGEREVPRYNHQYVASLLNTTKIRVADVTFDIANLPQRNFGLGSEWFYVKLYCGISSADLVLSEVIHPMVNRIMQGGLASKWFFVKYQDPDYHIRLRFLLTSPDKAGELSNLLNSAISGSEYGNLIWKIQPDTYSREIERYGSTSMEICESIFFIDSLFALPIIGYVQRRSNPILAFLIGVRLTDDLLSELGLTLQEKISFADAVRKEYQKEFEPSMKKINEKYALHKKDVAELLNRENDQTGKFKEIMPLLNQRKAALNEQLKAISALKEEQRLTIDPFSLMSSLVHMMLNRLITHKERLHELMVYEFLYMYYNTARHTLKTSDTVVGAGKQQEINS